MSNSKLRFKVNMRSLVKSAELASNTVLLASNAYLAGSSLTASLRHRKQERQAETMRMTAELASAAATGIKVVAKTWSRYHEPE